MGGLEAFSRASAATSQTISFGTLPGKTYGAAAFTISATASSGLPVSFTSLAASVCTVSGSTVTVLATGTCTIQASQAGNSTYAAAPSINQSFTVAKAAQTITFGALPGKTYGNPPFSVSANASSGLAVSFSSTTAGVCTVSGNTVTIVAGGTCSIKASQAGNADYLAATAVMQSFAVSKTNQSITFGALANQTYGVAPFTVSAAASSGLAVAFATTTTAVCTVSGNTVTIKTGGTCALQATQSGNASYNAAANVSQSFAIAKASQTIAFGTLASRIYGVAPFSINATASSGLAVTFSSLTTTVCTVSGGTVTIKLGGTCTIQATQAGNASYNAAPSANQSFTVDKANQVITFNALASKTYGNPPFTVSAAASSGLAVSFFSLTGSVCTVSGSTATLVAAGTCTIQAAQAGSASYNAAPNVSQSFAVALGSQTITFAPIPEQILGTIPPTLSATASSGLAVTFASLTTPICAVSGTTLTLRAAGTCTIQASQPGSAGYAPAANVNQSFAIIAAIQFAPQVMYAVGTFPWGVATGDFNGDGNVDAAVVNLQAGTVSTFLGNGAGGLVAAGTLSSGGIFPENVVVGDFNHDGKLDLAVGNSYSKTVAILLGSGNGTFGSPRIVAVSGQPFNLAAGDLNGDGKLDLVVVDGSDGTSTGQTVEVLLGNGDGSFRAGVTYATGPSPIGVTLGDFNGDGKPDLAVTNADSNTLSILLGNGDGTLRPALNYATAYYPEFIAAADLNRDGKTDLVILNSLSNSVSIFLGNGDGSFAPRRDIGTGQAPQGLAIADFNGDGKLDLAIANSFDNDVQVLLGVADGTFHTPALVITGTYPAGIAAADLNRDGKLDLVVANYQSNTVSVILNASTYVPPASVTPLGGTPQSAAVNTAYGTALSALVRDNGSNALQGTPVTFVAPASGASGTFSGGATAAQVVTNASGIATAPPFTANSVGGSFSVVARAGTVSGLFALTNTVGASPAFTSAPPPNGTINLAYSHSVTASGAPPPSFSVVANSLPPGLAFNGTSGLISGTPNTIGTFAGTLTAANGVLPNATQSFAITISGLAQTITFAALVNRSYGGAPFAVSATASSGLAVSFASLTTSVCTVTGTTVTIVNLGTCTIQASQGGNATYAPALNVNQSFAVTQASQTVSFGAIGNTPLGTPPFALSASATSGLIVSFASLTTSVCTASGSTVILVATGTCTIRASQPGSTYYTAAPNVDRSFTVAANQPPTVSLAMPKNSSSFVAPATIPLLGTASDPEGSLARVEFYNGATMIGASTTPPYTFTWPRVPAGSYALTARAYDNAGAFTTSLQSNITVAASGSSVAFLHTADPPVGNIPTAFVLADFNRDGNIDLVAPLLNGSSVSFGTGTGVFQQLTMLAGIGGGAIVSADFNGDGVSDIALAAGTKVFVALSNGNGTFRSAVSYPVGSSYAQWSIVARDFNGDGNLDIATTNDEDGTVSVLLGNGDGTFRAARAWPAGTSPSSLEMGDFNGDGKLDLVALNRTSNSGTDAVTLLLGNGDGTFRQPLTRLTGTGVAAVAAGDFDGDARLDLAIADPFGRVAVLLGNGDGTFGPAFEYPVGAFAQGIVVAEFNGDGKLDIATANTIDNTVSILLGNGNGSFRAPYNVGVGSGPVHLAAADLNGDGLLDIVADSTGGSAVSVLINATGKTDRPPTFTSAPLPGGDALSAYSYTVTASGFPASTFAVTSGALPPGLTLQSRGVVAGNLPLPGMTYTGTITARNGVAPDATQAFSISSNALGQTITFDPIVLVLIPPAVNATASSGLPVTLSSLTPGSCQLTGSSPGSQIVFQVMAGTCSIRAAQGGSVLYLPAANVDQTFAFDLNPPLISLSAPADRSNFAAPATITLTATLGSSLLTGLVNHVDFYAGNTLIGTATTRPYTVTWPNVAAGTYVLTAKATTNHQGGTSTSSPSTVTVTSTAPPTVTLTAPANNATYAAPANIAITASASSNVSGGSIGKVEFYAGGTLLATDTTAPFAYTWNDVAPGPYTLTAKATNNLGVTATSAPVTIIVAAAPAPPAIALTNPGAGTEYAIGQGIMLTAQASTPGRTIDRVEFYADGSLLGSVPVTGGYASATTSFTWIGATLGTHVLAAKVLASDGANATATAVNVTVSDLSVVLLEPYQGQIYQAPAVVRMTANPTKTAGTIAQVDFYGDGILLGTSTVVPYTFGWPNFGVGAHTVKAVVRDASGLALSSPSVAITVTSAPTLQIAGGLDGSSVADDNLSVTGTVQAPTNSAVTVNGRVASLHANGSFTIDNVELQPGSNTLSVALNSQDGSPLVRTIIINSVGAAPFDLRVDPAEGFAPFATKLTISNRGGVAFQRIEIDIDGDNVSDTSLGSLANNTAALGVRFPDPGIHPIGVKVFDAGNNLIFSAVRKVLVRDPRDVAVGLASLYLAMLDRLALGNTAGALNAISTAMRPKYSAVFTTLQGQMSTIVDQLRSIQDATVSDQIAELHIVRTTSAGPRTFSILFMRGEDGVWRIEGM